jgi:hypothetical protein
LSLEDGRGPYGVIYRRLWHRPDFRALSFEAKAVYAYAKTCPAGGLVGVFPLRPEDVRDDLGLGPRLAERALRELEAAGFIRRERAWIWIVDALGTTPKIVLENGKHRVAALKALAHVPYNLAFACRKLYGLNDAPDDESDTNPHLNQDHGDGDGGDGDGDGSSEEGKGKEIFVVDGADAIEERIALLRRQGEEITAGDRRRTG